MISCWALRKWRGWLLAEAASGGGRATSSIAGIDMALRSLVGPAALLLPAAALSDSCVGRSSTDGSSCAMRGPSSSRRAVSCRVPGEGVGAQG